jgi:hypothetical protein
MIPEPEEVALASVRRRDIVRTADYRRTANGSGAPGRLIPVRPPAEAAG